jgi:hypothetical protein
MKIAGPLLMLSGSIIMLSSLFLLPGLPSRTAFCLAALAVQALGFILLARSNIKVQKKPDA